MRIATFNVQSMRLRRTGDGARLDGARDKGDGGRDDAALDVLDRRLTAEVIHAIDADVVALQEVFDRATLDHFHNAVLMPTGCAPYPHRVCLTGNDGQGLNVALMSRIAPERITSHAAETAADLGLSDPPEEVAHGPVFRRDCLEVHLPGLALFVCHFKAPWPDRDRAARVRRAEAEAVRHLVGRAFPDPAAADWVVLGDLNAPARRPGTPRDTSLAPLADGFALDVMERLAPDTGWTFRLPETDLRARPDAILLSPALAARHPDALPVVFRAGMDRDAAVRAGPPFGLVGRPRPHASDHAAIYIDLGRPPGDPAA